MLETMPVLLHWTYLECCISSFSPLRAKGRKVHKTKKKPIWKRPNLDVAPHWQVYFIHKNPFINLESHNLSPFFPDNINQTWDTIFKKRSNGLRHLLLLNLVIFALIMLANADHYEDNSYIRKVFDWDSNDIFNVWYAKVRKNKNSFDALSESIPGPF